MLRIRVNGGRSTGSNLGASACIVSTCRPRPPALNAPGRHTDVLANSAELFRGIALMTLLAFICLSLRSAGERRPSRRRMRSCRGKGSDPLRDVCNPEEGTALAVAFKCRLWNGYCRLLRPVQALSPTLAAGFRYAAQSESRPRPPSQDASRHPRAKVA